MQFVRLSLWLTLLGSNLLCFGTPTDSTDQKKSNESKNKHPLKQFYTATGSELIFAMGDLQSDSIVFTNKLRFSFFPHIQQQYHYNFTKSLGIYTGISLINVGFRNEGKTSDDRLFELRQRSFSLSIPLALKLGNLERGNYIAVGASAECMFHYKYKLYFEQEKSVYRAWFSEKLSVFNPSVFVDLRNHSGGYIRFKYYLYDFLSSQNNTLLLPGTNQTISFTPQKSSLFFISVGSTFMKKKPHKLTRDDV